MRRPARAAARLLQRFRGARSGATAIEFALIVPVLALVLFGAIALFLLYRESSRAEVATFTVADILSRRYTVDAAFLRTTHAMFARMVPTEPAQVRYRVSSLKMKAGELTVDWSFPVSPLTPLTDPRPLLARLPLIAEGDSLLVVETGVPFEPLVDLIGIEAGTHVNVAANRPRFTSAVAYVP